MTLDRISKKSGGRASLGALICALAMICGAPAASTGEVAGSVAVLPANTSPKLRPVAVGFADWVARRVVEAGVEVSAPRDARMELAALQAASGPGAPSTRDLLTLAGKLGAERVLLLDLSFERGRIDVLMRVHRAKSGRLEGAGRAAGSAEGMPETASTALGRTLEVLGAQAGAQTPATSFALGRLSSYSRSIEMLDRGELSNAWTEIAKDTSPAADSLREEIIRAAAVEGVTQEERVRLTSAQGESEAAWTEIRRDASEQLYATEPSPEMLLTAGEIQLARGKLHEAQAYFERVLELAPESIDARLGLGQALASQQNEAGARQVLEHARSMAPTSPRALELMADMPEQSDEARAAAHLLAGREAGVQLDLQGASHHFDRAAALDPSRQIEALGAKGDVQVEFGEYTAALETFRQAIDLGDPSVELELGVARSLRGQGDSAGAENAYRSTLELDRENPDAVLELGQLYSATDRDTEARPMLEQAVRLAPDSAEAMRALAHTLYEQGELESAIPLLEAADQLSGPDADGLRELAAIQRKLGRGDEAAATLERAVGLDPTSVTLRRDLASLYDQQGKSAESTRQLELLELLGGSEAIKEARNTSALAEGPSGAAGQQLDGLVASFGLPAPGAARAVLLGVHQELGLKDSLLDRLLPTRLDLTAIEEDLARAIDPHYDLAGTPALDGELARLAQQLGRFSDPGALDPGGIAQLNTGTATDSTFVAEVRRSTPLSTSPCPEADSLHVELRRLSGKSAEDIDILTNQACLPGGASTYARWNLTAAGAVGLLILLVGLPLLRGFGRVRVRVKLPDNTRALLNVSLTRRPLERHEGADVAESDAKGGIWQRLRSLGSQEQPLGKARDVVFTRVAARRGDYSVTLHGPLYHAISEQLIDQIHEERAVRVRRGRTSELELDLAPKDCPVEVMVYHGTNALNGARVAVRGAAKAHVHTSNGAALIYLPKGKHTLVVGTRDRACERLVEVRSFDPLPLVIDLADEGDLVFKGCTEAVTPFLGGDFEAAARALEEAGQKQLAQRMRAKDTARAGGLGEASRTLEEAGELSRAAEMLATEQAPESSASLLEQAGDFQSAAEAHRASGDLAAAGGAYEAAEDFTQAIECYRELGANDRVLALLEKTSDYYEAGLLALEMNETDRAVHNLRQVEERHPLYSGVCRSLGSVLADQGDRDAALEKLDEAFRISGIGSFPVEMQDRYGRLLEEAGRLQDAIETLSALRRQSPGDREIDDRIQSLKQRVTSSATPTARAGHRKASAADGRQGEEAAEGDARPEARYEILDELGDSGLGVVYRARDHQLDRLVALRRLPEELREDPAAVDLFEHEARSAAVLNHPNIVAVYDSGHEDGQYFVATELVEGTPLDAILKKRGALPPLVVAQLGVQIATGLHFAHRNKIVHRDLRTANLFLTKDKIVKIMDFGLAGIIGAQPMDDATVGGPLHYQAPELAEGGDVDHRADLYALGMTLYQLSTGKLPFTEGDIAHHHQHTAPVDPRELEQDLPDSLADLIMRLIEKDRDERTQKAADVVRVLQAMLDERAARRSQPS